jgi:hypothetical protein
MQKEKFTGSVCKSLNQKKRNYMEVEWRVEGWDSNKK